MRPVPSAALILMVAALAACGDSESTPTPLASSGASTPASVLPSLPEPTPTPGPPTSSTATFSLRPADQPSEYTGTISCTGPIGTSDPVALVFLAPEVAADAWPLVLRDYADWTEPRTACTFTETLPIQLIDARHVVIQADEVFAVVDLPEVAYHWFALPPWTSDSASMFGAVSPRLDELAWITEGFDTETGYSTDREVRITSMAGDTTVLTLPERQTGFCGYPADGSAPFAYARSGDYLMVSDQNFNDTDDHRLWILDGLTTVHSILPPDGGWPAGENPASAVWAPRSDTLYYRQGDSVWQWTADSGVEPFLPEVRWSAPTITPSGRHIAYWEPSGYGTGDVYLLDLEGGRTPQRIGQTVSAPRFLNDVQLWFMDVSADRGCAGTEAEPAVYNLLDGSVAPAIIEQVRGVWPGQ